MRQVSLYNSQMENSKRKEIGRIGESAAARFIERKGFVIIERNYRKPWGEIDIIAEKAGVVRFIEVKTLSGLPPGYNGSRETSGYRPEEQIHQAKLRKIARTAQSYMAQNEDSREFQIDAVGVYLDTTKRVAHCRLFEQIL